MDSARGRPSSLKPVFEDYYPTIEWSQDAEHHLLRVDLPDFRREELRVQIDNSGKLTVRGRRHAGEGKHMRFDQAFEVPEDAIPDKISGRFEDGILFLVMPRIKIVDQAKGAPHKGTTASSSSSSQQIKNQDEQEQSTKKEKPKSPPKPIQEEKTSNEVEPVQEEKTKSPKRPVQEDKTRSPKKPVQEQKPNKQVDPTKKEKSKSPERPIQEDKQNKVVYSKEEKPMSPKRSIQEDKPNKEVYSKKEKIMSPKRSIQEDKPNKEVNPSNEEKPQRRVDNEKKKENEPLMNNVEAMKRAEEIEVEEKIREEGIHIQYEMKDKGKYTKKKVESWYKNLIKGGGDDHKMEKYWLSCGLVVDDLLETINSNTRVIAVAVAAFSVGFYVSQKLRSSGR